MPQFKTLSSDEESSPPETSIDAPFPINFSMDFKTEIVHHFDGIGLEVFLAVVEIFFVRRYLDLLVINSTLSNGQADNAQLCYVFLIKPLMLK